MYKLAKIKTNPNSLWIFQKIKVAFQIIKLVMKF